MSFGIFQFRRDSAADWTSANPVLASGELGLETDTQQFKIGDGTTAWNSLAYGGLVGPTGPGVPVGGSTNQVLGKTSGTNYATSWRTQAAADTSYAGGTGMSATNVESAIDELATEKANSADVPPNTRTISTTAPLTGGGDLSANRTLAISAATTSAAGSMSGPDKLKVDNLWYDVTNYGFVGNGSTDNSGAWTTLKGLLPVGAIVYFPPGTYNTSTELTIDVDKRIRFRGAGQHISTIQSTSTTANIFNITVPAWFNTFDDLGFTASVTKTAGAAIAISSGSAVGTDIRRCTFTKVFYGIHASGSQSANLSVWDSLNMGTSGPAPWPVNGRGVKINGDSINLVLSGSTINLGPGTGAIAGTACVEINQSGAVQIYGCDLIGGANTVLLNGDQGASTSVAAVYCTNTFMDQSGGSTLKITGNNIVNRCKFVQCGITTGDVSSGGNAVEIAQTGSGAAGTATARADGINFIDCDIYPNGTTGTSNGFLITGAQGVAIQSSRISGWTNGIQITPSVSAGYTKINVSDNKLGATNNFTTPNTVGVLLNAGSFTYGPMSITGNDFSGSTTPVTDASTFAPQTQKLVSDNVSLVDGSTKAAASLATALTTVESVIMVLPIPANSLRVGTTFRWNVAFDPAVATVITARIRIGTSATVPATNTAVASLADASSAVLRMQEGLAVTTVAGGSAAFIGNIQTGNGVLPLTSGNVAASGTFNSGVQNYVMITLQNTTSTTTTVYGGVLEIVSP